MRNKFLLPAGLMFIGLALSSCESEVERYCFTVSDREPSAGTRVTFNGSCSEGIDLYHWNFGDGKDTVTRTETVEHVYEFPGSYQISLHSTTPQIESHCPPDAGSNGARQTIEVK
jgi:chitodextrinase